MLCRDAALAPSSWDPEKRTMEIVLSTGSRGVRSTWGGDYEEELSMDPTAIRLDRINNHAPFLSVHNSYSPDSVLGKLVPGSVRVDGGQLLGVVQFAADEMLNDVGRRTVQKMTTGLMRNISVGYDVHQWRTWAPNERQDGGKLPLYRATDWEPMEASVVPMGFDDNAMTRSVGTPGPITPKQEQRMDKNNTAPVPGASAEPAAPNGVDIAQERQQAAAQERQRCADIRARGKALRIAEDELDKLIGEELTVEQAAIRMIDLHATTQRAATGVSASHSIESGTQAIEKDRAGIVGALASKLGALETEEYETGKFRAVGPVKIDDNVRRFRHLGLVDMGRVVLEARGINTRLMNKNDLAREMLTRSGSVIDFPNILLDAAHKSLVTRFMTAERKWLPLGKRSDASDFKTKYAVNVGTAPDLVEIPENGDYREGSLVDAKESYALKTYGAKLALSRQCIINDDLGAFDNLQAMFLDSSIRVENSLVWAIFSGNPTMADGYALFHTNHANTSGAAAAPSVTTLDTGFQAMNAQEPLGGGDPMMLEPLYIVHAANYRATVDNILNGKIVPNKADYNVPSYMFSLKSIVAPVNSATWFLVADPAKYATFEYAYLGSASGLQLEQLETSAMKGIEFGAYLDFAAKAVDYRGFYRNAA